MYSYLPILPLPLGEQPFYRHLRIPYGRPNCPERAHFRRQIGSQPPFIGSGDPRAGGLCYGSSFFLQHSALAFVAVTDPEDKERLKSLAYNQQKVADASVVFIILGGSAGV
jgi:hypothetical protein